MDEVRRELAAVRKEQRETAIQIARLHTKVDVLTKRGDDYKGLACDYLSSDALLLTFQAFNAIAQRLRMIFNGENGTLHELMGKKHVADFLETNSFPYKDLGEFTFLKLGRDDFAHPLTIPPAGHLDNIIAASGMSEENGEKWKKVFLCLENLNKHDNVKYPANDLSDKQEEAKKRAKETKEKEAVVARTAMELFAPSMTPPARKPSAPRLSGGRQANAAHDGASRGDGKSKKKNAK